MKSEKCPQCDKTFVIANDLRIHIRTVHEKVINHVCPVCNKGFYHVVDFRRHTKSGLGCFREQSKKLNEKEGNCPHCNKTLPERSLTRHVREVHKTPENITGMKSTSHNSTATHIFQCKVCKKKFKLRQNLKEHLIKIHIRSNSSVNYNSSKP